MTTTSEQTQLRRNAFLLRALKRCETDAELRLWIEIYCAIRVPTKAVCPHHDAPFDYLKAAYFEPAKDLIVWAPRGGGKTRLGAIATLLDLLHKPGISTRIIGGSLAQSLRMWEHLEPDLRTCAKEMLVKHGEGGRHSVTITNGSSAAVLTQSERAVRGLRVQRLRCDEVELFDREIWEAAQLVTRSMTDGKGNPVHASIEAMSTFHKPYGLMAKIVDQAKATPGGVRLVQWCILDVLERCPDERECGSCDLHDDCGGVAKTACDGFFSIDDAINIKRRVSVETWEAEMLCKRPSQKGCVFRTFDENVHVVRDELASPALAGGGAPFDEGNAPPAEAGSPTTLALDFGYAAPFVCLWIVGGATGDVFVVDEYVQEQRTMDEHIEHIEARRWGKASRVACDPAGNARNEQTAASNVKLLRSRGYGVRTRKSAIVDGLEMIRAALKPASGKPTLFIHARCQRLIKAMRSYHYAPGGSELPVKDGEHDHLIDALRYWFVNRTMGEVVTRLY
ncbi:MAG: hypothetical protein WBD40_08710 [Tepidisphaeraceae bacterium]